MAGRTFAVLHCTVRPCGPRTANVEAQEKSCHIHKESPVSKPSAQSTSRTLTGKCLCGDVRYEVIDSFLYAQNCHCSNCRRATGLHSSHSQALNATSSVSQAALRISPSSAKKMLMTLIAKPAVRFCTPLFEMRSSFMSRSDRSLTYQVFVPQHIFLWDRRRRSLRSLTTFHNTKSLVKQRVVVTRHFPPWHLDALPATARITWDGEVHFIRQAQKSCHHAQVQTLSLLQPSTWPLQRESL